MSLLSGEPLMLYVPGRKPLELLSIRPDGRLVVSGKVVTDGWPSWQAFARWKGPRAARRPDGDRRR